MPSPAGFGEAVSDGAQTAAEASEAVGGGEASGAPTNKLLAALMATEPNPPVGEVAEKWGVDESVAYAIRGGQKVIHSLFGTGVPAGEPAALDFIQAGVRTARSHSDGDENDDGEPDIVGGEFEHE